MKILLPHVFIIALTVFSSHLFAQLTPLTFQERTTAAVNVVEGEVVEQKSFWNNAHTMIFTSNKVRLAKSFKGNIQSEFIQVITQGGQVGDMMIQASDLLELKKGDAGIFLITHLNYSIKPAYELSAWDVYGSAQGFYRYGADGVTATTPFETITIDNLYKNLQQRFQQSYKVINDQLKIGKQTKLPSTNKETATITNYSPLMVTAGTLGDPANNVLTINGSGFGNPPSTSSAVLFKDADNNNQNPSVVIPYNSLYIISWTDNQIKVRVPSKAASGRFAVLISPGDTAYAPLPLIDVFYSVLNAQFDLGTNGGLVLKEPRLMNANGQGGYTVNYSTNTAGGGRDISTAVEKATFERALKTWQDGIGFNVVVGATTTIQTVNANDKVNVIMFDNNNTSVPPLAAGVLAVTYNGFSMCSNPAFEAQKIGFDIIIRNTGVSTGTVSFQAGPCFPSTAEIDLEAVLLHELGHAVNLGHINDTFQSSGNTFITTNPSKLMHYSVLVYTNRRSLDQSALQGGLYAITPQNKNFGNCGLFQQEMVPLTRVTIPNDECPGTFTSTASTKGLSVTFDLFHATSNKYTDPQYTAVNCAGTGTFITNNTYQTIRTSAAGTLTINIANYATFPPEQINCAEQALINSPFVEASCELTASSLVNSGRISLASCLPNSTPHWSKLKMFQITPCTKILCSYKAIRLPNV
jgi:hypothetical protein